MSHDAIVLGAGVNGLAAAVTLARAGKRVLVLERADAVGGQSALTEFAPGFRAAPLALDADWLPPAVTRALGLQAPARRRPDLPAAVPLGDGAWLGLAPDPVVAAEAIRRHAPADAAEWPAFVARVGSLAGFLEALYLMPPPDIDASAVRDLLPLLGLGRKLRGLGRRGMVDLLRVMPMSVQEDLDDRFGCEPLKALVGATGITDLRQGPRSGGTAFVMLHHHVGAAGAIRGRGYWSEGPGALADALAGAARAAGVTVRTGAGVARIEVDDAGVTGVMLTSGEALPARAVLSSADPAHTLLRLVDPVRLDPDFLLAVRNIKFRGCTSYLLHAMDALPPVAGLGDAGRGLDGVLSLTASLTELERAADAAKYGETAERPHVELRFPSLRWPALAPAGKHVAVASVQWTPHRPGGAAWTPGQRDQLTRAVAETIERAVPGFGQRVVHRVLLTPEDLETTYGLTEGAATQGELTLDQILFMRPVPEASRYATPVPGLFLCGSGCHPGPGIAGVSGWLAARRLLAGA